MSFTDIFIRRPVLASVVNLMILALGRRAMSSLPVLQYPRTQNAVITLSTTYYGADPDVIAGFITTPLENAIAQANGIDYMSSKSSTGVSTITINLRLNYDADQALTEINTKVSSVLNQLPSGTQQPVLKVQIGQTIDAMYIGFDSCSAATRSRITSPASLSRSCRPSPAFRPRKSLVNRILHCGRGSIRRNSRPMASVRQMSRPH
jgi:multidrug efflux pump